MVIGKNGNLKNLVILTIVVVKLVHSKVFKFGMHKPGTEGTLRGEVELISKYMYIVICFCSIFNLE